MITHTAPEPITKKKLLAVEGKDELNFFDKLFEHMGLKDIVDLREVKGKHKFKDKMPSLKNTPGFHDLDAIAIIRDADENSENTFISVQGVLKQNDLQPPEKPGEFSNGTPKVGVFIMPDNKNSGMLETLCLSTVQEKEEMECVDRFIDCANELENPPKEKDKAKTQAFLALMPEVPDHVGIGAQQGVWNFDSPVLEPLKKFLSELK
jgi:hypothetical protein